MRLSACAYFRHTKDIFHQHIYLKCSPFFASFKQSNCSCCWLCERGEPITERSRCRVKTNNELKQFFFSRRTNFFLFLIMASSAVDFDLFSRIKIKLSAFFAIKMLWGIINLKNEIARADSFKTDKNKKTNWSSFKPKWENRKYLKGAQIIMRTKIVTDSLKKKKRTECWCI